MHHLVLRLPHTSIYPSIHSSIHRQSEIYTQPLNIYTIMYSVSIFSKWYVRLVDSGNGKKQPQAIWTISQPLNWNAIYLIISKLDLSALVLYLIILLEFILGDAVRFFFWVLYFSMNKEMGKKKLSTKIDNAF